MATYRELSKFTNGELTTFTYSQLNRLTIEELSELAQSRIDVISEKDTTLAEFLQNVLTHITSRIIANTVSDIAETHSLDEKLTQFLLFLQSLID